MNINNAFPSNYLKADDITEDLTLTITKIEVEKLGAGDDAEEKPIVYFKEREKGIVLNKTNATTIAGMYGPETEGWIGKAITLFATEVDFQGRQTMAIRVRMRKPQAAPQSSVGTQLTAIKARAWKEWCEQTTGTPAEQMSALKSVTQEVFKMDPNQLGISQWDRLIKDGFQKPESPFEDVEHAIGDIIPF